MKLKYMSSVILAFLILLGGLQKVSAEPKNQNILLIIADDYGVDANSLYNDHPGLPPTPNIDNLAKNGRVFDKVWSQPSCSPSRACMLTGRMAARTGVGYPIDFPNCTPEYHLDVEKEVCLPKVFNADQSGAPYKTALIGKWHLTFDRETLIRMRPPAPLVPENFDDPIKAGFEYWSGDFSGFPDGIQMSPPIPGGYYGGAKYTGSRSSPTVRQNLEASIYRPYDKIREAIDWIENQGDKQPWFLWLGLNLPHSPFHTPPKDIGGLHLHDYDAPPKPPKGQRPPPSHAITKYSAMIQTMDSLIGELMKHVDLEETTVIFVGDNGTPAQTALVGGLVPFPPLNVKHSKGTLFEGGIHVPMIVAGKAVDQKWRGTRSQALIHVVDLFPTIMQLAGLPSELLGGVEIDGVSFFRAINRPAWYSERETVFAEWIIAQKGAVMGDQGTITPFPAGLYPGYTIRDARYKYIDYVPDERLQYEIPPTKFPFPKPNKPYEPPEDLFYDLKKNPWEVSGKPLDVDNLTPGQQGAYNRLLKEMKEIKKDLGISE